jgi:hypothetical protein
MSWRKVIIAAGIGDRECSDFLAALAGLESLQATDFRVPVIDKLAVEEAISEYLSSHGAAARPLHWFADAESARDYLWPTEAYPAYSAIKGYYLDSTALDAAWMAESYSSVAETEAWSESCLAPLRSLREMYEAILRTPLAKPASLLLTRLSSAEDQLFTDDPRIAEPVEPVASMLRAVAAGLFYVKFGVAEVVCIPRPSLWLAGGQLHREDGAAVEWPSGERRFFWRGVNVPGWMIEKPKMITATMIRRERNLARRRSMIELFDIEQFLRRADAWIFSEDQFGRLWRVPVSKTQANNDDPFFTLVEVINGSCGPDGTQRRHFLEVPPWMNSPRQAVAWTYGLQPEQYELAVRT